MDRKGCAGRSGGREVDTTEIGKIRLHREALLFVSEARNLHRCPVVHVRYVILRQKISVEYYWRWEIRVALVEDRAYLDMRTMFSYYRSRKWEQLCWLPHYSEWYLTTPLWKFPSEWGFLLCILLTNYPVPSTGSYTKSICSYVDFFS